MACDVTVRPATTDDLTDVLGVLDAAALETDAGRVRLSIERDAAFVAVRASDDTADATVLGALVALPRDAGDVGVTAEIDAVAVRRARRAQGIGCALVAAAAERYDRLVAEFDPTVRPFYESLGFAIGPVENSDRERYRGELRGDPATEE